MNKLTIVRKGSDLIVTYYLKYMDELVDEKVTSEMNKAAEEMAEKIVKKEVLPLIRNEMRDMHITIKEKIIDILRK